MAEGAIKMAGSAGFNIGGHFLLLDRDRLQRDGSTVELLVTCPPSDRPTAYRISECGSPGGLTVEQLHPNGTVAKRSRMRRGFLQDGRDGAPALELFAEDGLCLSRSRYTRGLLQDGAKGEPAVTEFFADGQPSHIEHYSGGARWNGPAGGPAVVTFDRAGNVVAAARCVDGRLEAIATPPLSPSRKAGPRSRPTLR